MRLDRKYISRKCVAVEPVDTVKLKGLRGPMHSLMYTADGDQKAVGLAANQCGCNQRFIYVDYAGFDHFMVNPRITKYRGGICKAQEKCISFPGGKAYIWRYKIVLVEWFNTEGVRCKFKARGLLARIIQHEIDHLDGIDMFERERLGLIRV